MKGLRYALGAIILVAFSVPQARGGFSLGDAANYAVLFEGLGGHSLMINNGPGPNGLAVTGNLGIGNNGQVGFGGPVTIDGNINFNGAVVCSNTNANCTSKGNVIINGTATGGVTQVQTDLNNLNTLSSSLGAEMGTALAINVGNGSTQTVNASDGTSDGNGNQVFTVNSVHFVNGATLDIQGAPTDFVVLNIAAGGPQFGGAIVLTGGITSDHVLFNVFGSGNTLQISTNGATETGTFLDPLGTMSINHSVLNGRFFGGDTSDMGIVSGGEVNAPMSPVPEPTFLGLLSLGVVALIGVRQRWTRRTDTVRP